MQKYFKNITINAVLTLITNKYYTFYTILILTDYCVHIECFSKKS